MIAAPLIIGPWTSHRVEHRLRETVRSLRASGGGALGPAVVRVFWPEMTRDEFIDLPSEIRVPRLKASPEEIDRMDATLGWLSTWLCRPACAAAGLAEDSGAVVWLRAAGWSQSRVAAVRKAEWLARGVRYPPGGNSRPSLERIEERALRHLADMLNRTRAPMDRATAEVQNAGAH